MPYDRTVVITSNKKVNGRYYKLTFVSPQLAGKARPGQFVQIQVNPGIDPFLRRPFSYYRVLPRHRIEILYEILGKGTAVLSEKKKGEQLQVMGPLGRPFSAHLPSKKKRVLVGGGIGVPPLIFLAERCPIDYLLIGAKSKEEVLPKKELANVQAKILYSTNDGSYGRPGFVTGLLKEVITGTPSKSAGFEKQSLNPALLEGVPWFIQTCGPKAMMKAVLEIARERGIPGEVSLDKTMACGVGACLGCMVKTTAGWVPSCTEGPVFGFGEIEGI